MLLLDSMLKRDSSEGLLITCKYLLDHKIDKLQDEWISMSSYIGKFVTAENGGDTWYHVNNQLLNIIEYDKLNVKDALTMTAKLYLLFQKLCGQEGFTIYIEENIKKLREGVIDYFPDSAMLSYKGLSQFSKILPNPLDDLYKFYNRILAGLIKLFVEDDSSEIRKVLEYLTRKKNKMPMPHIFPCPNSKEAKKGDQLWFLWGAVLLYYDNERININWKLFMYNWRQSIRNDRVGLLWGIPFIMKTNIQSIWNKEELRIIEKVQGLAPELWKEMLLNYKPVIQENYEEQEEEHKQPNLLESFVPRIKHNDKQHIIQEHSTKSLINSVKVLHISSPNDTKLENKR